MPDPDPLQQLLDRSWASSGAGARSSWPEGTRMTARQLRRFLASQRFCVLASTGGDGEPHLVPVSFLSTGDGRFWLPSVAGAVRLRDLQARPRLALIIGQGMGEAHRLVLANGSVEVVPSQDLPATVRGQAELKLGDVAWAAWWLLLRPDRLVAYRGGPAG